MNQIAKTNGNELATTGGFGIEGLEDIPVSVLPVPFLRLVQPSSKKVEMSNGQEARMGSYYYNDTQEEVEKLRFCLLKAKIGKAEYEVDGETRVSTKLNMLGFDLDRNKIFILTLSVMSISNFGKLIANFKQKDVTKTWEYEVTAKSTKTENKKGKFYIADFELGKKTDPKIMSDMEDKSKVFGVALNRDLSETDKAVEVEIPTADMEDSSEDTEIANAEALEVEEPPTEAEIPTKLAGDKEEVEDLDELPF